MENYIVRIYRRDEADPKIITGTFESVEDETRQTFSSLGNLVELLTPNCRTGPSQCKRNKNKFVDNQEPSALQD